MKKRLYILLIACLLAATAVFAGCNSASALLKKVDESILTANSLVCSIVITDGGATVYSFEKTVFVDGDNADVTVDEAKLGDNFVLNHEVTKTTCPKSEQLALPFKITADDVSSHTVNGNLFTCVISKDSFAAMLNSANMVSANDVSVMFVLVEGKCQQMLCNYLTETGKAVAVTVTCEY